MYEPTNFNRAPVLDGRIAGGCTWIQSGGSGSYGSCTALPGSVGDFGPGSVWTAMSHRVYLRRESGMYDFNTGGDPRSAVG
jgi:hypothetical protein